MSYLVLARKYRPQAFSEVVGQEHVTRTLANAFRHGRVHHGFLLCGPRGVGKTTLARLLGKALNCEQGPTAEPCGVCEPCVAIATGTAVDYYEMDGASNRGIDAIRELTDAVKYQPAAMRKKVYVIDEVHMLTTEAFNALLKTLEEPPPHVTFILATTEPHKVPVTILSRCQRYDFKLVPGARLAAHLRGIFEREEFSVEPAAVDLLVRESGGSVRDALSLADQVISYVGGQEIREAQVAEVLGVADRALVRSLVESLARGDARAALEVVDSAVARGLDEVQVARALTRVLHDIAVAQVDAKIIEGSAEEQAELARLGRELQPERVRLMCDRMMRACQDLADSPEPRIVVDLALIDLAALDSVPPISELVDRLVELERRLSSGSSGGPGGGSKRAAPAARPPARAGAARSPSAPPSRAAPAPEPSAPAPSAAPPAAPASKPSPAASEPAPASPAASAVPTSTASPAAPPSPAASAPPSASSSPASKATPAAKPSPAIAPPSPASIAAPAPAAVPTPSETAAGSGKLSAPGDPLRAWADVMAALEAARELTLLGWYQHAVVLKWDAASIELGFPAGAIVGDMASEPRNVEALRAFLGQHLGAPVSLSVRVLSAAERGSADSARSIVEAEADRRREESASRSREAREHPVTKMVLDTFGASIEEIKTDV
jgi:DNA polymerase-3 subunit gamma/tau